MWNQMRWDASLGLVQVNQSPDETLEFCVLEIRRQFEYALFDEQITGTSEVPDYWLLFGKAPTQGVEHPKAFAFALGLV
jgi:hypothetical protein